MTFETWLHSQVGEPTRYDAWHAGDREVNKLKEQLVVAKKIADFAVEAIDKCYWLPSPKMIRAIKVYKGEKSV
jgi:hypothetical protein